MVDSSEKDEEGDSPFELRGDRREDRHGKRDSARQRLPSERTLSEGPKDVSLYLTDPAAVHMGERDDEDEKKELGENGNEAERFKKESREGAFFSFPNRARSFSR